MLLDCGCLSLTKNVIARFKSRFRKSGRIDGESGRIDYDDEKEDEDEQN